MPFEAPFPYYGGKKMIADEIWRRFGRVDHYIEPFAGSLAVLLARPDWHPAQLETVNDIDGFVVNFWRAVAQSPADVAKHADWPVSEADLHARSYWLLTEGRRRLERLLGDPFGYDAQIAGWWVWCNSTSICGWYLRGPWVWKDNQWQKTHDGDGIRRSRPLIVNFGRGIHALHRTDDLLSVFDALAIRLRRVRITCGDFARVLTPAVLNATDGTVGVLLDPPYASTRHDDLYLHDDLNVSARAREWAIAHGDNPRMRIALCGYDGKHDMPSTWTCHAWTAHGGHGVQGDSQGRLNRERERIWFSPHCLAEEQMSLF